MKRREFVNEFTKGDEIYGVTNPQFCGANAKYAVARANMVALRPTRLSHVEAASAPVIAVVIPIVASVGDAIGSGLASSLARPSSNITGVSDLTAELSWKRLEIQCRMARPVYSEDCRGRYHAWGAGAKGGNDHDSNCVLRRCCAAALANVPPPPHPSRQRYKVEGNF